MSFARRLSTIKFRNPFKRQSKAARRTAAPTPIVEEPPAPNFDNQRNESQYKPLKNGPKRKSKCYCCERRFTTMENFLSLGQRKCAKCRRKICKTCANTGGCHICAVKQSLDLDPENLMKIEAKELVAVLSTLHFADVNFVNLAKPYLIKQLFTRLEVRPDWNPEEMLATTSAAGGQSVRNEAKRNGNAGPTKVERTKKQRRARKSEGKCEEAETTAKPPRGETKKSIKCGENSEDAVPANSKVETVRLKKLQDPESKNVEGIPSEDLCKICMDFRANCILLNCGHLVACIYCSDLIKECPICRKPIVRVIQAKK